ncbi:MAG: hypothetical protein ACREE4_20965 [Stellaceae bacterium]
MTTGQSTHFIITWNRNLFPAQLAELEKRVRAVAPEAWVVQAVPGLNHAGFVAILEPVSASTRLAVYRVANDYLGYLTAQRAAKAAKKAAEAAKRGGYARDHNGAIVWL